MKSLKAKLTLRLLLGGVVLLGLAGTAIQWRMRRALTEEFDTGLRLSAQSLQAFIEEDGGKVSVESDVDGMPQFSSVRSSSVFLVRQSGSEEIKRSPSLGKESLPVIGGSWGKPAFFETDLTDGRKLRCIGIFLFPKTEKESDPLEISTPVLLVVGQLRTPLDHTLSELRNTLLISGVITLAGLAGMLLWGVRHGLRPLDQLVMDISKVTASSLATRFPVEPLPTELRPISGRLNELLERLSAVFEREKRFTANVSHELRTPLAELRALAEVNLMVPPESATENAAGWSEVKTVSGRMESLALRLLEIARAEQPRRALAREVVDISMLVEGIWARHAKEAAGRGITLEHAIPRDLRWEGDPELLGVIVDNLIGNAVHHAVAGSILRISADDRAICFGNETAGLTEEDLPDLFEPFWKKDESRSDGRRHGLGLALARETAVLSGGLLTARMAGKDAVVFKFRKDEGKGDIS